MIDPFINLAMNTNPKNKGHPVTYTLSTPAFDFEEMYVYLNAGAPNGFVEYNCTEQHRCGACAPDQDVMCRTMSAHRIVHVV